MSNRKAVVDVNLIGKRKLDRDSPKSRGSQTISELDEIETIKSTDVFLIESVSGETKKCSALLLSSLPGTAGGVIDDSTSPIVIAHGLGQVPRIALFSSKDSDGGSRYISADSTNITITFTGSGTRSFWWYASI